MPTTILIAEDSRAVRTMVRGVLECDQHQVVETENRTLVVVDEPRRAAPSPDGDVTLFG
jgi:CheY-like chemotaxis protein